MARIELKLKTTRRWWFMPLLNCAAAWYWITGQNEIAPRFIDWIVRHGINIEISS